MTCQKRASRRRQAQARLAALEARTDPAELLDMAAGDPLLALDLALREPEIRREAAVA